MTDVQNDSANLFIITTNFTLNMTPLRNANLKILVSILLVGLLACAIYLPFFSSPPIFDDWGIIAGGNLAYYATTPFNLQPRTFPHFTIGFIQTLSQSFEVQRAFNTLLHVANSALLFLFLLRFCTRPKNPKASPSNSYVASLTIALIFAAHPVATYGVAYLVQRTILFATFFSLIGLTAFYDALENNNRRHIFYAALACSFAILSKEHAITAPLAIAGLAFFSEQRQVALRRAAVFLACCAPVAILALMTRFQVIGQAYEPLTATYEFGIDTATKWPLWLTSVLLQSRLFFSYLRLWLLPDTALMSIDLRPDIPDGNLDFLYLLAFGLTLLSALFLVVRSDRYRTLGFGVLYSSILFTVEFSTIRFQEPFVLYRSYLWAPGFLIATLPFFERVPVKILILALPAILTALSLQAVDRLASLSSNRLIWTDAAEKLSSELAPGAYRILFNRGMGYLASGQIELAQRDMNTVIAQKPTFDGGHHGLALIYMHENKAADALLSIDHAIQMAPQRTDLVAYKADVLEALGRTGDATALRETVTSSHDLATLMLRGAAEKRTAARNAK